MDETQLVSWQVIVVWVDVTPAGDSSEQESPCDSQNRHRPMDMNNSLNDLVYNAIQRGPVNEGAQKLTNHLRCGFLFMLTMLASGLLFTAIRVFGSRS